MHFTEKRREGLYSTGDILFTSETNNVNARFTSDYSIRRTGFTLDVQAIPCSDRENYPEQADFNPHDVYSSTTSYPEYGNYSGNNGGCDESAQEVQIPAGETNQGALVTNSENDGNYPNNACQNWNIITDENQVLVLFQQKFFTGYCVLFIKITHLCAVFYCLSYFFQCIVIRVGDSDFNTESGFDFVKFEDSSSGSGINITY